MPDIAFSLILGLKPSEAFTSTPLCPPLVRGDTEGWTIGKKNRSNTISGIC